MFIVGLNRRLAACTAIVWTVGCATSAAPTVPVRFADMTGEVDVTLGRSTVIL